jgi:hypothetical protein
MITDVMELELAKMIEKLAAVVRASFRLYKSHCQ